MEWTRSFPAHHTYEVVHVPGEERDDQARVREWDLPRDVECIPTTENERREEEECLSLEASPQGLTSGRISHDDERGGEAAHDDADDHPDEIEASLEKEEVTTASQ